MEIAGYAAVAVLASAAFLLRVVPQGSRYAVFELGKFKGLKGAGVVFRAPFGMDEWVLLELGTTGELVGPGMLKVSGRCIPVEPDKAVPLGSVVRIAQFRGDTVVVVPEPPAQVSCPGCGLVFEQPCLPAGGGSDQRNIAQP